MKSLTLILALTFSVMFSSPSFAGWKKVITGVNGDTFYVDFESIRKHGGYVYFWTLGDRLKPSEDGTLSFKHYSQGDCKLFRSKFLSYSHSHQEPMGGGTGNVNNDSDKEWTYPQHTVHETVLKSVCAYAK